MDDYYFSQQERIKYGNETKKFLNLLGLEVKESPIQRFYVPNRETFDIRKSNTVFFYPVNDGIGSDICEYYYKSHLVMSNETNFSNITNLDEILIQMTKVYQEALTNQIILDPYTFLLEIKNPDQNNYKGEATLALSNESILNFRLREEQKQNELEFRMNQFLDHFIGWNFGASVQRNPKLKQELETLNKKLFDLNMRHYAGSGFSVYGSIYSSNSGIRHVHFPATKEELEEKTKIKHL